MHRVLTGLLVALAAAVFVGAGYVVHHQDAVPDAGQTPTFPAGPTLTSTAAVAGSPTGTAGSATRIRTVFLGDDYALGLGASSKANSWPARVAAALGLDATVVADRGAGYAKTAPDGRTYADLVADVVAARPDLVVVSGGRNDVVDDTVTLRVHARALFATLHDRLPSATLVAVAPFWGDSAHPAKLQPVDDAVRNGVQSADGRYLAISDPLTGHAEWMADEADPNDGGYRAIADAVTPALRPSLPR